MAGDARPTVAIILVNWNGWRDTIACLRTCLALTGAAFRLIVCDNASRDGSVDEILAWARGGAAPASIGDCPVPVAGDPRPRGVAHLDRAAAERGDDGAGAELLIVSTGGNLGFAGGNNIGLRWALARGFSHAWLLNNDTAVPSDALAELLAPMQADPRIGLTGSVLIDYEPPHRLQAISGAVRPSSFRGRHRGAGMTAGSVEAARALAGADPLRPGEIAYPVGASMLASRAFLETVGLMEESYFLYYEETDWVLRAAGKFDVAIAERSIVYHRQGTSAGSTSVKVSRRAMGFLYRSRLRAARLHRPAALPGVVIGMADEAARRLLRGDTAKALAAFDALTGRVTPPAK